MIKTTCRMITGAVLLLLAGCSSAPRYAETYPMSFDQTYQTVLLAVDDMKPWKVVGTDQMRGLITVESGGFYLPRQELKISIEHREPYKTDVKLHPRKSTWAHQKFFETIDARMHERALAYPR